MRPAMFILGVNHRSASVAVRERLAYADDQVVPALGRLKAAIGAIDEAAVLSTCNRVEIIGVATEPEAALAGAADFLGGDRGVARADFEPALYRLQGRDAVRHLFRVGASLDSMVVGEPQILGQLKTAYAQGAEAGTVALVLHRAFHKAFSVAKRVRQATLIGHGAVSVSSAAVALARQIFDTLEDKTVMLMGAGKMAELTARHLKRQGVGALLITSRTFDHAVAMARELDGTPVAFDHCRTYLKLADVVIGSLATTRPILAPEEFRAIIHERRYKPVFLIDLGVPRNFDERLNAMESVYLYDIDDLGAVMVENRGEREREAKKAETIVELELDSFWRWLGGLELVPAIKQIRSSIESLRDVELARHQAWLAGLAPQERERIENLTRGLMNKLLHRVLTGLRSEDKDAPDLVYIEVARRLLCDEFAASGAPSLTDDEEDL